MKIRPSDYFSGEIIQNNKVVSTVSGSYLNFIEFDEVFSLRKKSQIQDLSLTKKKQRGSLESLKGYGNFVNYKI